jgi:hypothetical protein
MAYEVYRGLDSLTPGKNLKIEHYVSFTREQADISELAILPPVELERRRADSARIERVLFEQLTESAGKWEEQAAITQLLDRAIEYGKTPAAEHSGNQWRADNNGCRSVSNAVYEMRCQVYEETRYDRENQASVPVAWKVTWEVFVNTPKPYLYRSASRKIAGQDKKRFADKAAADKYIKGRIAAYSHLFAEISPPIPPELAEHFKVNGLLLPGYRVAGDERAAIPFAEADRPKASVLERIAADKAERTAQSGGRGTPAPGRKKRHDAEL